MLIATSLQGPRQQCEFIYNGGKKSLSFCPIPLLEDLILCNSDKLLEVLTEPASCMKSVPESPFESFQKQFCSFCSEFEAGQLPSSFCLRRNQRLDWVMMNVTDNCTALWLPFSCCWPMIPELQHCRGSDLQDDFPRPYSEISALYI